jgi:NTE family protein
MLKRLITTILICVSSVAGAQPAYKYLVLKGGGIRGIAYTGAIKVIEEQQAMTGIEKIGGTSIGALVGAMLSVGVKATELEQLMQELDVASFNDGEWYFVGGSHRMKHKYGWYKGDELEHWLAAIIGQHTGSDTLTLGQLHQLALKDHRYKDLYVTSTNLSRQRAEVFSWENRPDMRITTAVRASVSIPLYYTAVRLDASGHEQDNDTTCDVYTDGGLTANFPIRMFNTPADNERGIINQYTLGLKLERPEQMTHDRNNGTIAPYNIHSLGSYMGALYNLTIESLNPSVPYEEEKKHTIYISTSNMSPKVRKITKEQKKQLFNNGVAAATAFFTNNH